MAKVIPPMDFRFNGEFSSPFLSAPSTPKRFGGGHYLVGDPTSPGHLPDFDINGDLDHFSISTSSVIPLEWEEKPGTQNLPPEGNDSSFEDDFAFHVSDQTRKTTLPAEELFDGGKIRPLKPPPKLQPSSTSGLISKDPKRTEQERGRERAVSSSNKSRSRRGTTRSLSPLRVSAYPWEDEEGEEERQPLRQNSKQKGCRKWRLKDFFLFRSASEGRASEKDPIRKYRALLKKHEDEKKSSSFRSIEGSSNSNGRAAVSAHELHYTVNRAISEDLKKKTFLPYKQGILGRLAFNPAVHALANGFGFSRRR
ncbi:uncharacterized protein LOC127798967 [Diospyros lotus]|uniref:uncharacterized protein LOC127798967 n=1 Tax=Diospyros lotus TaxID=55363 RepID=UPI00225BF3CE|nr:uncharacterized protein LOC127798967 [Diospyros lotus]